MVPLRFIPAMVVLVGAPYGCGDSSRDDTRVTSSDVKLTRVFAGLSFDTPVLMLQAPGNNSRWYVVEQGGLIRTFESGDAGSTIFADLTDRAVYSGGRDERGRPRLAGHEGRAEADAGQLGLFAPGGPAPEEARALEELRRVDPDRLTPLDALALLARLRAGLGTDET